MDTPNLHTTIKVIKNIVQTVCYQITLKKIVCCSAVQKGSEMSHLGNGNN
jgi:hypothetical protein